MPVVNHYQFFYFEEPCPFQLCSETVQMLYLWWKILSAVILRHMSASNYFCAGHVLAHGLQLAGSLVLVCQSFGLQGQ